MKRIAQWLRRRVPRSIRQLSDLDKDWNELQALSDEELIAEFEAGGTSNPHRFRRTVEVMGIRFYKEHRKVFDTNQAAV